MFRNNLIALLLFASGLFTMVGCEPDVKGHPEPECLVTINIPASLLKVNTGESAINSVVFFGVDAVGAYIDKYSIDAVPAASQSLTISGRIKRLYAIANPTEAMVAKNPSETELEDMIADFSDGKPILPIQRSGWGEINNNSVDIDLVRTVAKIEINGKKGFKISEVTVANTPNNGYVFQGSTFTIPDGRSTYTSTDTILYVAENTGGTGATQFTVTGTYNNQEAIYNFVLDNNLDIVRNKHYCVGISPVTESKCSISVTTPILWLDALPTNDQIIVKPNPYKNGIKILAIGNSYSENAMQFMCTMLRQVGVTGDIMLVNAFISGGSIQDHVSNIKAGTYSNLQRQTYTTSGKTNSAPGAYTLKQMIQQENWDVITLQQKSDYAPRSEKYDGDLDYLIQYVYDNAKTPKNYKLGWHMTWAYAQSYFDDYPTWLPPLYGTPLGMYNAICTTVQGYIVPKLKVNSGDFDFIIPSGTAIQNARKPEPLGFDDYLNYDGTHLDNRGCYIAAAMWIKTITGYDVARLTTPYRLTNSWSGGPTNVTIARETDEVQPSMLPRASFEIIRKAVNAAAATPFATTSYTNLDP